jgi:hypothetical protein
LSTRDDFPAPGAPVIPITSPRPVNGKIFFINCDASLETSSTFEIARATARVSPAAIRSTSDVLLFAEFTY